MFLEEVLLIAYRLSLLPCLSVSNLLQELGKHANFKWII